MPLGARMAAFAELRERTPFLKASVRDPMSGGQLDFYASTRYADIHEISKRPQDFCSGQGSVSVFDMPPEAMEFFGSFIAMDNPRHARQRGIVGRSFAAPASCRPSSTPSRRSALRSSTTCARRGR